MRIKRVPKELLGIKLNFDPVLTSAFDSSDSAYLSDLSISRCLLVSLAKGYFRCRLF